MKRTFYYVKRLKQLVPIISFNRKHCWDLALKLYFPEEFTERKRTYLIKKARELGFSVEKKEVIL